MNVLLTDRAVTEIQKLDSQLRKAAKQFLDRFRRYETGTDAVRDLGDLRLENNLYSHRLDIDSRVIYAIIDREGKELVFVLTIIDRKNLDSSTEDWDDILPSAIRKGTEELNGKFSFQHSDDWIDVRYEPVLPFGDYRGVGVTVRHRDQINGGQYFHLGVSGLRLAVLRNDNWWNNQRLINMYTDGVEALARRSVEHHLKPTLVNAETDIFLLDPEQYKRDLVVEFLPPSY